MTPTDAQNTEQRIFQEAAGTAASRPDYRRLRSQWAQSAQRQPDDRLRNGSTPGQSPRRYQLNARLSLISPVNKSQNLFVVSEAVGFA
jgi:hypothetical protein